VAASCGHDDEPSGSIKGDLLRYKLSDYQLLKKDSTTWSWLVSYNFVEVKHELVLNTTDDNRIVGIFTSESALRDAALMIFDEKYEYLILTVK
jgi:hypothetical protein